MITKVKIFAETNIKKLENKINSFIQDKQVTDIKYYCKDTFVLVMFTALVIYRIE